MPARNSEGPLHIGEWIVNPSVDTIAKGSETHKLEPRTMRLLMCLASCAGEVVSVERLLNEVWSGVVVGPASVYQTVSQLRKLLGDVDADPTYIATVPRKGYRLIAPVRPLTAAIGLPESALALVASVVPSTAVPRKRSGMPILAGAITIALIAAGGVMWLTSSIGKRLASTGNSIVVLPFIDMTAEKADQAFCDGLTEELSSWLAQIPTLRVVARTSAFAFRGRDEDVRKIGKALDTSQVLEGSMRRSGDRMRITVQLIDARNGYHLWSETFDRPVADSIKIQEDVSRSVAQTLKVRLTTETEREFASRRTADAQAYQLYLLGRYYSQQLTSESTERAVDLYRQVLSLDPNFAPAYTQLAYARLNQGLFHGLPTADVAAQVEPLIDSALKLDDRLSAAYAARGALRVVEYRTKEALEDLEHAISLNPSDMPAYAQIGRIHLFDGQPWEALKSYDRASSFDPLNFALQAQRCKVLDDLAQFDEAAKACERARILQPHIAATADGLAWLAESRGRIDEALRWNAESVKAEPGDDFDLYWTRATLFLSIGMAGPARAAVELGRRTTKDEDSADAATVRVVYQEGGAQALRRYLDSSGLDDSPHSVALFEASYAHLLLGEPAAAKESIARALNARDRIPGFAELPFYARGARAMGTSFRLDLAAADLALGDRVSAQKGLNNVLEMLNKMIAAGVERNATYELRAKVYALAGNGDEAMRDLRKAAKLGWRRAWWAVHEPYFASLQRRSDFQALIEEVTRSNGKLTDTIKVDL